jgi:hypothetical protein
LDNVIKNQLPLFFKKWHKEKNIDLRNEILNVFEDVVALFLFGEAVKDETATMLVTKKDGTIVKENQVAF